MNMQSMARLAMSALLALSFAYTAQAVADDSSADASADNGASMEQAPTPDNGVTTPEGKSDNNDNAGDISQDGSTNADQGTPDTPTGDDDY